MTAHVHYSCSSFRFCTYFCFYNVRLRLHVCEWALHGYRMTQTDRQTDRERENLSEDSQQSMTVSLLVLTRMNGSLSFTSSSASASLLTACVRLVMYSALLRAIRLLNATNWHVFTRRALALTLTDFIHHTCCTSHIQTMKPFIASTSQLIIRGHSRQCHP